MLAECTRDERPDRLRVDDVERIAAYGAAAFTNLVANALDLVPVAARDDDVSPGFG